MGSGPLLSGSGGASRDLQVGEDEGDLGRLPVPPFPNRQVDMTQTVMDAGPLRYNAYNGKPQGGDAPAKQYYRMLN